MKHCFRIAAVLLFCPSLNFGQEITKIECENASFCNIDTEKCLKTPLKQDDMRSCRGLYYPKLYKRRLDTTFWVQSSTHVPFNAKFGVLIVNRTADNWNPAKDCCDLKLNQTCELRPLHNNERFRLFATDGKTFCYQYVQEHSAKELKWCNYTTELPDCLYIKGNGEVAVRRKYEDASVMSIRLETDYCFFEAPVSYTTTAKTIGRDGLVRNVHGIEIANGMEQEVKLGTRSITCRIQYNVSNVSAYVLTRQSTPERTWCFFARTDGVPWYPMATCALQVPGNEECIHCWHAWMTILVILPVAGIALLLLWLYFMKIRQCYPSYIATKDEISKNTIGTNEGENFLQENMIDRVKEIPDELNFGDDGPARNFKIIKDGENGENIKSESQISRDVVPFRGRFDSGCPMDVQIENIRHQFICAEVNDILEETASFKGTEDRNRRISQSIDADHAEELCAVTSVSSERELTSNLKTKLGVDHQRPMRFVPIKYAERSLDNYSADGMNDNRASTSSNDTGCEMSSYEDSDFEKTICSAHDFIIEGYVRKMSLKKSDFVCHSEEC